MFPGTIVISDTMYYARWVDEEMDTIRLNLCYDEKDFDVILREHNTKIGALPFPRREGYVFLGWFANDTDTESVSCETVVTSDMELYARWEAIVGDWFMITLNAEGGVLSFEMFQVESKITALPVPVRYGYEFLGWSTREVAGEIIGCGGPCEPFAVTEDMTLYAYWRPMYYKLCLASDIIGVPADMCSYQIGQDVKLSNPFHNPGYTFLGWGLDYKKNGGQVVYVEDQVVPSLSDVEGQRVWLYAIWGEPEPLDFPTALNVDCSLTWTTGGKEGWKAMATDVACDGISCARSGDISSYENSWVETTVEGAGTLEFSWKNSCKTDDDSFGLIIDGKLQGACYGGNARWQKMTVKLGKGTHTLRWVYERGYSYGSAATGYGYIDNVMWVPATTYYIEFVANGGKGTMECQEMVSNLEAKLNLNSFVKEDCHFCGWALNSEGIVVYGDGQSVCGLNPDENGIVRLYAIWEPSYSFTFRSLDASSVEVTGMSVFGQMSGRIVIPERINDKNVVKIGASAFSGREIYSVSIPATVNKIGSSAFSGCVNLRSVSLEEGVVEIADLAFSQCASLQHVNIPLSVKTIGCSAFKGCAGLGDGVVVVDDCVLTVNGECPTDVRLPSNVRIVTCGTFMSCESLASITIPPGVDNIGMRTFAWCSKLGFVALPSTITNLDFMAFSCCSSLKSITIPSSVVTIGDAAFMLCGALEKIIIQGGVERISEQAFLDCSALTEITLPKSVRFVGRDAFDGCSSMKIVWVEKGDVKRMRDLLGGSGLRVDSIEFQECEEPIPDLPASASAEDVANALKGSCDDRLMANVTDAVMYEKYRAWALKIGADAVKNSENAWVSFAVDSDALLEKSPVDEDLAIEEFKPTDETGRFDFTVRVKDIEIGSGALAENLKKVFGLTGATTLDADAFKHENVDVEFDTPKDGVLKFTAKPAKVSDRFFMRVKVK